MSQGRDY